MKKFDRYVCGFIVNDNYAPIIGPERTKICYEICGVFLWAKCNNPLKGSFIRADINYIIRKFTKDNAKN